MHNLGPNSKSNLIARAASASKWIVEAFNRKRMPKPDWIDDLITHTKKQSSNWCKARRKNKICNWVENATARRTCSGLVLREGSIYCPYHDGIWEEMTEKHTERKPRV